MARQASRMLIGGFRGHLADRSWPISAAWLIRVPANSSLKTQKFVLYFNESVKGLEVGSSGAVRGRGEWDL